MAEGQDGRLAAAGFAAYRSAVRLAAPLIALHLRRRRARGREDPARSGERWGYPTQERPPGPLLWVHAASLGECLSVQPLIETLRRRRPALRFLVTTTSSRSSRLITERLPEDCSHQFAPIDHPAAVARFLEHWRPDTGLLMESELWPTLLGAAAARGVRLVLINARISPRSFAGWRRLRPLARGLLSRFSLVLAQSALDRDRLAALGAAQPLCLGNLKDAAAPLQADEPELRRIEALCDGRDCWLAASTHPGEEAAVAEAHATLAPRHARLLTILVPRHAERGGVLRSELAARGLEVAQRSAGQPIRPTTQVYLADTLGELGLWCRLAPIVFVGGSLVPHGGQNLLEPAKLACAILTGPHTGNFSEIAQRLERAGGLLRVQDAGGLAGAVARLLGDPALRQEMGRAAHAAAAAEVGVLERVLTALEPHLPVVPVERSAAALEQ